MKNDMRQSSQINGQFDLEFTETIVNMGKPGAIRFVE
jgi:hypothetical protein